MLSREVYIFRVILKRFINLQDQHGKWLVVDKKTKKQIEYKNFWIILEHWGTKIFGILTIG